MPYVSKAETERRRWVDLAGAIRHVKAVDACDHRQALQSIKAAIQDEKIPYRWEDQARPPRFPTAPVAWAPPISDMLPNKWQLDGQMRLKDTMGRFRVLLLLKFAVDALFEQPPKPEITSRQAPASAIKATIEQVYNDAEATGSKPPNIKELPISVIRLLKNGGYCTSKKRVMELGDLPEFKRRRRKVGKTLKNEQRFRGKSSH